MQERPVSTLPGVPTLVVLSPDLKVQAPAEPPSVYTEVLDAALEILGP